MNVPLRAVRQPTIAATNCLGFEPGWEITAGSRASRTLPARTDSPMAIALRRSLAVATVALTSSFLPAVAAEAAPTPGSRHLTASRTPGIPRKASTKPCDSADPVACLG
jgi:hypothetical protein